MNVNDLTTFEEIEQFLAGTRPVAFVIEGKAHETYSWIQATLVKFRYLSLGKRKKGLITQYLIKISGYSRQQIVRLIQQYREGGFLRFQRCKPVQGFQKKYTAADVRLLVELDTLHDNLSGPATKHLCARAYNCFGQEAYKRLAGISVSHLYNLRHTPGYERQRIRYEKTKPKASKLGVRKKPRPEGRPGYIRIDTVHQGDFDGQKGVYHINAVDEVTQFEVVCSVEKISEHFLIPVLEDLLTTFPFPVLSMHSDNGSEYVNHRVVDLLNKLNIAFTKSRPRHSNDNGLAETKNGAIVRKMLGYGHIPQHLASQVHEFNREYLNPYLNYHRPCYFPMVVIDTRGRERTIYPYEQMRTPYERLKSLPQAESYLRPGITFEHLEQEAMKHSDNESARLMQQARAELYKVIHGEKQVG